MSDESFGVYRVYTVEFFGKSPDNVRYTNFAVVKGEQVVRVFYFIEDVARFASASLGWRSILSEHIGLVSGFAVLIFSLSAALALAFTKAGTPPQLWSLVTAATGFVFGSRTAGRHRD